MRVLAFGGGKDSTALLQLHFEGALDIDAVVFSDTGAEHQRTYENVDFAEQRCAERGLPFYRVRKDGERIQDWLLRLGTIPLMPGGGHVCSLKFKGEVMQKWANLQGEPVTWIIGIEANEGRRVFKAPKGDFEYPLVERGITRADCDEILARWGMPVGKSSCVFCPFMKEHEIKAVADEGGEAWELVQQIEARFSEMSPIKNQAWVDAGKPLNKGGRAPAGMWRRDSWSEGARLFAKRKDGRQLSVQEWAATLAGAEPDPQMG